MSVKIKNCGLKTPEDIHAAAVSGASFVGFVHHAASPRHLSLEDIAALSEQTPASLAQVVVLVDPSDETLAELQRHLRPHFLQIHEVAPKRIGEIAARTAIPIITAVAMREKGSIAQLDAYEALSAHLLLDSSSPGSGASFDWSLLADLGLKKPWFLAGGLTAQNVASAIRTTGAPMVDVSSGIESAPGVKSAEMIAAFNKAVLNASHA